MKHLSNFLFFFTLCIVTIGNAVHGVCTEPRIRRGWSTLTSSERKLYVKGFAKAMQDPSYIYFTQVHSQTQSEQEAHRTCGFLLWHRRFLLALENLIRRQGRDYECLTLPYWDYFTEYQDLLQHKCGNLKDCSEILFENNRSSGTKEYVGLGGNKGSMQWTNIDGRWFHEKLCTDEPARKFASGGIPRSGDWNHRTLPSDLTVNSLLEILTQKSYGELNNLVQKGFHNAIHSYLGGVLSSYKSPADPLFWSHHATIDMMHYMYFRCNVDPNVRGSPENPLDTEFTRCGDDGLYHPEYKSKVFHKFDAPNGEVINAHQIDNLAKKNYKKIPQRYYQFVDAHSIDNENFNSYSYELTAFFENTLSQYPESCPHWDDHSSTEPSRRRLFEGKNSTMKAGIDTPCGKETSVQRVKKPLKESVKKAFEWHDEIYTMARNVTSSEMEARNQIKMIECAFHNENVKEVSDFDTQTFKNMPYMAHNQCHETLKKLERKEIEIVVKDWRNVAKRYFKPKKIESKGCLV